MSHSIKINDKAYNDLREMQAPRETYNDVVSRLLDMWRMLQGIEPILSGHKAYQEFRNGQLAAKKDSFGREAKTERGGQP